MSDLSSHALCLAHEQSRAASDRDRIHPTLSKPDTMFRSAIATLRTAVAEASGKRFYSASHLGDLAPAKGSTRAVS